VRVTLENLPHLQRQAEHAAPKISDPAAALARRIRTAPPSSITTACSDGQDGGSGLTVTTAKPTTGSANSLRQR
jgi:hypothetical protein